MDIAAELRAERARRDLTQTEVGLLLGVGQRTIVRWEAGDVTPGVSALQVARIANFLRVPQSAIMDTLVPQDDVPTEVE